MGKGSSPPPPTDPEKVGRVDYFTDAASAGFGVEHGLANKFTPGGSVTFDKYDLPSITLDGKEVDGGQGVANIFTQFAPQLQSTWDTLVSKGNNLASQLPSGAFNPDIESEDLRQAYVNEGLRNITPVWDREDNQFKTLMAERGQPIGGEIWNDQSQQIGDERNRYVQNLTDQAHQAAATRQGQLFNMAMASHQLPFQDAANFGNILSSMQANLSGDPASFIPIQGINVDTSGNFARYDQQRYNNWAAEQANSPLGPLANMAGTLGAAMIMRSDKDAKENIKQVGKTNDGQPIYQYNYKGEPRGAIRMGLLAQNVEVEHPEAVHEVDGVKHVDYGAALKDAAQKKRA